MKPPKKPRSHKWPRHWIPWPASKSRLPSTLLNRNEICFIDLQLFIGISFLFARIRLDDDDDDDDDDDVSDDFVSLPCRGVPNQRESLCSISVVFCLLQAHCARCWRSSGRTPGKPEYIDAE